jgi:hypothetical protein
MHHLKALSQPIPRTVAAQTHDVFGIAIKSHNAAQVARKPCGPKSNAPNMGANVIDNRTRPHHSRNCILHVGFMRPAPVPRFSGETEMHPHSLREAGLNPHPEMPLDPPFKLFKSSSGAGPPP